MKNGTVEKLVLSMYPTPRGFSFVLFEAPERPVDWGTKNISGPKKNKHTLETVKEIIAQYDPDVIVIENTTEKGTRRSSRIRRLYTSIARHATKRRIGVERYSRRMVREAFAPAGAFTKYEIAKAIARRIPAFTHRLPRLRKLWMSEDPRQGLFDALALGLVYYNKCGLFELGSPAQANLT